MGVDGRDDNFDCLSDRNRVEVLWAGLDKGSSDTID